MKYPAILTLLAATLGVLAAATPCHAGQKPAGWEAAVKSAGGKPPIFWLDGNHVQNSGSELGGELIYDSNVWGESEAGFWGEGAGALRATFATTYPDWGEGDWLAMARRVMVEDSPADTGGAIRFDYDPRIAEPFAVPAPPAPDLWPGLEALGSLPLLLVRGGLSDILSAATLAEPEARAAIASLLEAVR